MNSHRPYIIRALNEWILDNDCTPYLLVNAYGEGVQVPQDFVRDGQIILNISPLAVRNLLLANEGIEFEGRFGGIPNRVYVPIEAVLGIYARENGQGMFFEAGEFEPPSGPPAGTPRRSREKSETAGKGRSKGKPSLRVVK